MTNQLIKKINLNHSFIFFLLINLFSVVMFKFNYLDISSTICLFLILTIGVSHGSLDNIKGKKLLKIFNFEGIYIFYIIYIFIALIVIFIWLLFPAATLLIFLSVAAFHFGKEDTQFLINKKSYIIQLLYLLKGLLIILAPLFFHFDDTVKIFKSLLVVNESFYLFLEFLEEKKIIEIAIILSSLSSIFLFIDKFELKKFVIFFDYFSIIILNYYFNPLTAFTIYFCFLHSVRHSISLAIELDEHNLQNGIKLFIIKALPLTILTIFISIIVLFLLNDVNYVDNAILKIIFIGLASLTFPHILLEYFLEKNEKQTN